MSRVMLKMRLANLMILFAIASPVNAAQIELKITELKTQMTSCYSFNNESSELGLITCAPGNQIRSTGPFTVQSGKLVKGKRKYGSVTELLYQADIGDKWVVLIRQEYNSYSGFKRLLSAFSGHSVQVSKIVILTIKNDEVSSKKTITEKASSYHWEVMAYKRGKTNEHITP